jgi:endoglucanase
MLQRYVFILVLSVSCLITFSLPTRAADIPYRGVNLSGAESGGCTKAAKYGFTYIYPPTSEVDYFMALGMNTFRIPFCWERLQTTALGEFDAAELGRLDQLVRYATAKGAYILLDPHNYGQYWGQSISTDSGSPVFADFWRRLATQYRDNNHVIFGLMNEPHGVTSEAWLTSTNAAVAAIRQSGAQNLILVPGTAWTGAHSWTKNHYGTPNAIAMLKVNDPANNYAYEVHQYFDKDSSGTTAECISADVGAVRIADLNMWLQTNKKKAFLGEFGGAKSDVCYGATYNLLTAVHNNPDLWIGWTYWSAGPWLSNYMFALPLQPTSPSQLDVLKKFLSYGNCVGANCGRPSPPKLSPPAMTPP